MAEIYSVSCGGGEQWEEMWPAWLENNYISIGYNCNFPLVHEGNRPLTKQEITNNGGMSSAYVIMFAFEIKIGDYVVIKKGNFNALGIAKVESAIEYSEETLPPNYHQFRKVKWIETSNEPIQLNIKQFAQQAVQYLGITCSDDNVANIQAGNENDLNRMNTILTAFRLLSEPKILFENKEDNMPLNQILYGPPGTGKTYRTAEEAVLICSSDFTQNKKIMREQVMDEYKKLVESKRISFVTFHQSYGYEEFVEGLKPILDIANDEANSNSVDSGQVKYHISDGVFKEICEKARKDKNNNYVIIIDEINRGNISKIFGELITLIEEDKREGELNQVSVLLPYSKQSFSVPKNLYIIGTMNTADRSLANVDTALRRRFHFEPMMPDLNVLDNLKVGDIDIQKILKTINQRIEALYDREHTIGHAYFTKLFIIPENEKFNELELIFRNKVIPLLEEYFFDDWQKIRLVLGDNQKAVDYQFIYEIENNYNQLFGNNELTDNYETKSYKINNSSFGREQSYIGIYTVQNNVQ